MPSNSLAGRMFDRAAALALQDALPRLAGLPTERLEAIRAGASFSAVEFEALCRALAVDPAAMYRGEDAQPERIPTRFRTAMVSEHPSGDDLRLLALAVEQGRILGHLIQQLGRTVRVQDGREIRPPEGPRETWREGYQLGERARDALRILPGPLTDLDAVLRDCGAHVARVAMTSTAIDGASIWEPGAVPIILLNTRGRRYGHPGAVRATLAHELCHLLHDVGDRNLTTQVSWGVEGTGNFAEAVEVRARAFAPAFLAPPPGIRQWHGALPRRVRSKPSSLVKAMAEHWGLSFEGAAWHAKNCDLLEADVASAIAARSGPWVNLARFEPRPAYLPLSQLHPGLPEEAADIWKGTATDIVLDALDEGHITLDRARELLTWS